MLGMLAGAAGSLLGGGGGSPINASLPGMSNPSSSSASTGTQTQGGHFTGGSVNFGAGSGSGVSPWLLLGVGGMALWLILKKK